MLEGNDVVDVTASELLVSVKFAGPLVRFAMRSLHSIGATSDEHKKINNSSLERFAKVVIFEKSKLATELK